MSHSESTFWLIAGPNGVGKTTFAFKRLKVISGSINFVNMDEIARGLSPLEPSAAEREAARIALDRAHGFIQARATFAMETTLSGRTHLRLVEAARNAGMKTAMLFFSTNDPAICLTRVSRRVAEGGHDVPEALVRRRFARGLDNLNAYTAQMDLWRIYEASGAVPRLALEGARDAITHQDPEVLAALPLKAKSLTL